MRRSLRRPVQLKLLLLTAALLLTACEASELPVANYCVPDDAANADRCIECEIDSDCLIGGDPCCVDLHRYLCLHTKLEDTLPECNVTCDLIPAKPADNRCACIDGTCQSR